MTAYSNGIILPMEKLPIKCEQNIYIKEEIMISDISDQSDIETKCRENSHFIVKKSQSKKRQSNEYKKENVLNTINDKSTSTIIKHRLSTQKRNCKTIKTSLNSNLHNLPKNKFLKNGCSYFNKVPIVLLEKLFIEEKMLFPTTDESLVHQLKYNMKDIDQEADSRPFIAHEEINTSKDNVYNEKHFSNKIEIEKNKNNSQVLNETEEVIFLETDIDHKITDNVRINKNIKNEINNSEKESCELTVNTSSELKFKQNSEQYDGIYLEDVTQLLNIPDDSDDDTVNQVTNNWMIDQNHSSTSFDSDNENKTGTDLQNCLSTSMEKKTVDIEGTKEKLFYRICIQCKKIQKRRNKRISKICDTCKNDLYYECSICNKTYKYLPILYYHLDIKHKKIRNSTNQGRCLRCGTKFKDLRNMNNHLKFCKVVHFLKCEFCFKIMKNQIQLKRHLQHFHKKEIEQNDLDNVLKKVLESSDDQNGKTLQNMESIYEDLCTFQVKPLLTQKYVKLYCKNCNKTFTKLKNIDQYNCKYCQEKLMLQCKTCEKLYMFHSSILQHLKSECTKPSQLKLFCNECDYQAISKSILRRHIVQKHLDLDSVKHAHYTKCNKKFNLQENLKEHEFICHKKSFMNISTDVEKCFQHKEKLINKNEIRDKVTAASVESINEVKCVVSNSIQAYCSTCGKQSKAKQLVVKCTDCKMPFIYRCVICNVEKNKFVQLRIHVIRRHTKKIFKCENKCGQCYSYYSDYRRHLKLCGKEPHLYCGHCSFRTKYKQTMMLHMLRGICHIKNSKIKKNAISYNIKPKKTSENRTHMNSDETIYSNFKVKKNVMSCNYKVKKTSENGPRINPDEKIYNKNKICLSCDHCTFRTHLKSNLESHILSKHAARLFRGINAFHCEKCNEMFKNYFIYSRHIENCHLREKKI